MIMSLVLSMISSAKLQWTDAVVGRHFVSSGMDARHSTIKRFSQLVAIMEHMSAPEHEGNYQPNDSVVQAIERAPCKVALLDSVDDYQLRMIEWGKTDSGFVFVAALKGDSMRVLEFFLHRPTEYFRDDSGSRFVWSHPGNQCERWKYVAEYDGSRFQFSDKGNVLPPKAKCKDPSARREAQDRIEKERERDSNLRCDVFDFFPRVGMCWSFGEETEPDPSVDPEDPDDY